MSWRSECLICFREFYKRRPAQRFCSASCRSAFHARHRGDARIKARFKVEHCAVCDQPYVAVRADARYCSAKCRQRAHRVAPAVQAAPALLAPHERFWLSAVSWAIKAGARDVEAICDQVGDCMPLDVACRALATLKAEGHYDRIVAEAAS
jgi:hypothetical protein